MNSTPADEQKFLELVNENRNRILKVCRVYSWNPADQDDLYQEILFQIWRGLPALKEKHFANTWLYRVAINTAISFVRKRASRSDRVVHFEHAALTRTIESQQATPGNNDDRLANLYTAIFKLDPLEKALVTLSSKISLTNKSPKSPASTPTTSASCCIAQKRSFSP